MARIRTIKPEIWTDELIGTLPFEARILWIGLITQADDEGRLRGNPALLRSSIFPYDAIPPKKVDAWLEKLATGGRIRRYEVRGEAFIQITNFTRHQRINRPSASQLPAEPSLNGHGILHDELVID